jgi:hypothetical protein
MSNQYEKGKVKVVWIEDDPEKIYSRMFDEKKEALKFTQNIEHFIMFSLETQENMEEFEWKLLPYGHYRMYLSLVKGTQLTTSLTHP